MLHFVIYNTDKVVYLHYSVHHLNLKYYAKIIDYCNDTSMTRMIIVLINYFIYLCTNEVNHFSLKKKKCIVKLEISHISAILDPHFRFCSTRSGSTRWRMKTAIFVLRFDNHFPVCLRFGVGVVVLSVFYFFVLCFSVIYVI